MSDSALETGEYKADGGAVVEASRAAAAKAGRRPKARG